MPFETRNKEEIERINRRQQALFDDIVHVFEPPLPEGVPERLEQIVAAAGIEAGQTVLDVGSGTGILVPIIRQYRPKRIYACDLSQKMLDQVQKNYPGVETLAADLRDLVLPDASIDAALINACYPNIADKPGAFANLSRMMKPGGRLVVSHPLGKRFVDTLRKSSPFPLDDFPEKSEAKRLLAPYGLALQTFVDDPVLYILAAVKRI
ncbi:MAG: class I SAM-dependent methyltransferase [Desulfobacterales bacterium]|nr:class I SAM-dependent methyltransferase [Desulfobacterales bacterium]